MKLRMVLILVVVGAICALLAPAARAQSGAVLTGAVIDPSGLPAARILVRAAGNGLDLLKETDDRGRFVFGALPVGTYRLCAKGASGTAFASVDLPSAGADVTLRLLKTVGSANAVSVSVTRGSGTDAVLNQTTIAHSPAYGSLPNLLLQLPGAARGANGVVHINGDHGDINYVVDGVSLPQALNREVGTEIDPADIAFMDVLEGAYPAQYGGRFAAVVNIDTKSASGRTGASGYISGASFASYDADVEYAARAGAGSVLLAAREDRSSRALDPPNFAAVHDAGSGANQFVRYVLPLGQDFLQVGLSHAYQTFQIPNDVLGGEPANTDDHETQDDTFANFQYHHALRTNGTLTYGIAFKRSRIRDLNDIPNDLAYGEASTIASGGSPADCSNGIVAACAFSLYSDRLARDVVLNADSSIGSTHHLLRYGADYDMSHVDKVYAVTLQPDNFLSAGPALVTDNAPNVAHTESAYIQDSWQMGPIWRADYGVRFDAFGVFSNEFARNFAQVSPRLKITRLYSRRAYVYAYAGRFFTPFSFENVSPSAAHRLNAPLQPSVAQFDLKPQRDTDLEIGGSAPLGPGQIGVRLMQKFAADLIDDTQVGLTALHQDINYAHGNISLQSVFYQQSLQRNGRADVSITHARSVNKGCETQLLAPCFGSPDDWTPADHDQRWDAAAGVTLDDRRGGWFSFDGEYGSGLSSASCQPLTSDCKVPAHITFDAGKGIALTTALRLTIGVHNVLNDRYRVTYLNAQGNHYAAGRTFEIGLRFNRQ